MSLNFIPRNSTNRLSVMCLDTRLSSTPARCSGTVFISSVAAHEGH